MTDKGRGGLFEAVLNRRFGSSTCFLCGCRLGTQNRTDEHVIPKWVQKRFRLADQQLHLLNGTTIPYRQLTIPCCRDCNNRFLQPIESKMSAAVYEGAQAVRVMDRRDLFIWLGKIFYGLLYREMLLPWDRTVKRKGCITSKAVLQQYRMHHLFLQAVRVPMQFSGFFPASILIVNTQEPDDPRLGWDFRDELRSMFIGCRMGKVGILGVLQDGGTQQPMFPLLKLETRKLHPVQFTEVMARACYKAILFNRVPKYIIADGDPKIVIQSPLQGFSTKPVFDNWNQQHYAKILAQMSGLSMASIFQPPDQVMTWLKNSDGGPKTLPLKKCPVSFGA